MSAQQKEHNLKILSPKSSSYLTDDISLKVMSYDPYLVPIGSEVEDGDDEEEDEEMKDYS